MRILHCISQLPDHTGSGTIYKNLSGSGTHEIHKFRLIFGCNKSTKLQFPFLNYSCFTIDREKTGFDLPGMSDIMPYTSSVFKEIDKAQIGNYKEILKSKLKEEIETFKPDIIWSHHLWIMTSVICDLAPNTPVIGFCHGTDLLQHKKCYEISKEIKPKLKKLSAIVLNGPQQKKEVESLINIKNFHFIGVPVNEDIFNINMRYTSEKRTKINLCYAGKISREKGVHHLLKSVINLIEKGFINLQLNIYGEGNLSELGEIIKLADQYKNNIIFHGKVDQESLAKELQKNDLFILPSFYEGLGLVVIEALMSGCKVVCNKYQNLMDILPPETIEQAYVKIVDCSVNLEDAKKLDFHEYTNSLTSAIEEQLNSDFGIQLSGKISESVNSFKISTYKKRLESLSYRLIEKGSA
ncbi:glycosyltransferase family 4 protein [Bacteroidota bacterium]